jgi:hypothetical protein
VKCKILANIKPLFASGFNTPPFSGLSAGTAYYVYARSAENGNYTAGTLAISAGIVTAFTVPNSALWAKSITAGTGGTFRAVAVDSAGNVYAAGIQTGSGDYGSGNVAGTSTGSNPVLVKYRP